MLTPTRLLASGLSLFTVFLLLSAPQSHAADASDPFLWGVATSSLQNEGDPQPSDWERWSRLPRKIRDGSRQDQVVPLWTNPELYLTRLEQLGAKSFRLSLAWERIQPSEDEWNDEAVETYAKLLESLTRRGIEPVLSLNHYVLPLWLADRGGITSASFPAAYESFVEGVLTRLEKRGVKLRYFLTFNEPEVTALAGYQDGVFPPGHQGDFDSVRKGMAFIVEAHIRAYKKIHQIYPEAKVSIAKNWVAYSPRTNSVTDKIARNSAHQLYNLDLVDRLMGQDNHLTSLMIGPTRIGKGEKWLDFIGINYYFRYLIGADFKPPFLHYGPGTGPAAKNGWEIYPEGLYDAVSEASKRWKLPVLITENGISAFDDQQRMEYMDSHLAALAKAGRDGAQVIGYLYWTLIDNFELAEGYLQKFGLISRPEAPSDQPEVRSSFFHFKQWISCWSSSGPEGAVDCMKKDE